MQPQGHVQVLLNKLRGFTPQACLDAPRFCISAGLPVAGQDNSAGSFDTEVFVEEGVESAVIEELKSGSIAKVEPPTSIHFDRNVCSLGVS
jgi:gamma-glutamyltranspeptidase/glutathione hydrolase